MTADTRKSKYVRIAFLFLTAIMTVVCFAATQQLSAAAASPTCPLIRCSSDTFCEAMGGITCSCFHFGPPTGVCHRPNVSESLEASAK